MKNECSVFKAHCNDRNLEGYCITRALFSSLVARRFAHLTCCSVSMVVLQMPQVTAEDEEGACHSEAEAGVIFSGTLDTFPLKIFHG